MLAEKLEEQTSNWIIPTDPCSQNQAYLSEDLQKNPTNPVNLGVLPVHLILRDQPLWITGKT